MTGCGVEKEGSRAASEPLSIGAQENSNELLVLGTQRRRDCWAGRTLQNADFHSSALVLGYEMDLTQGYCVDLCFGVLLFPN